MDKKKITLAYSPDTDDQFMVAALKSRAIDWHYFDFEFICDDIQRLNQKALDTTYDITAISFGAFPSLFNNYWLMTVGSSIGDNYGPAIVVSPSSSLTRVEQLVDQKIAVPGLMTSAHLAGQELFGPFHAVPMYFMEIASAVLKNDVAAGLLIHELQMNPETLGLRSLGNIGALWKKKFQSPLPLGGNVLAKRVPIKDALLLQDLYLQSIEFGLKHRQTSIQQAINLAPAKEALNEHMGDAYIERFVNARSLRLDNETQQGLELMYQAGFHRKLFETFTFKEHILEKSLFS
jgi:1,4-dihydroxy-6-naphthoate synthase